MPGRAYGHWRSAFLLCLLAIWAGRAQAFDYPNSNSWDEAHRDVRMAWYQRDVVALDRLLSREVDRITQDGFSTHWLHWRSIEHIIASGPREDPSQDAHASQLLPAWRAAYPRALAPDIVLALQYAHHARFTPDDVSPHRLPTSGWKPKNASLSAGIAAIEAKRDQAALEPHWFAAMMQLQILASADVADLIQLSDEARRAAPSYSAPHESLLDHLIRTLRWNGPMIETFITTVAKSRRDAPFDAEMYARLHLHLFDRHFHDALFERTSARWPLIRDGLSTRLKLSDNARIHHYRAAMACLAGDRQIARAALAMTREIDRGVWRNPLFYDSCSKWTRTGNIQR